MVLRHFVRFVRRIPMSESHSAAPFVIVKPECAIRKKDLSSMVFASLEPATGQEYRVSREAAVHPSKSGPGPTTKPNPLKMCF